MRSHHRQILRQRGRYSKDADLKVIPSSGFKPFYVSSSVDDPVSTAGLRDKLLKAPFQRVHTNRPPLFPWRHSAERLARLDPSSPEFEEKGQLLGGGIVSSHPLVDEVATAWMFMNAPWYSLLFFRDWQDDLAENMSWAFVQGLSGMLSNVYRVPMNELSSGDGHLLFDYTTKEGDEAERKGDDKIADDTAFMIQENLRKLYQSAHEFGKYQLQVRLDCRPIRAHVESLFAFPFLSRALIEQNPGLKEQYYQFLHAMSMAPRDALPICRDLVDDMHSRGVAESTVICQVLVECEEVFWVKDLCTGKILQGNEDEEFRKVFHLVRFERVVETIPRRHPIMPFRMVPGNWQITDIDDHLDGNLIL